MKRFIIFLILPYFFMLFDNDLNIVQANAVRCTYAKVTTNCILYKSSSMTNGPDDIFFVIPETYFVTILDKTSENCYKVQYDKFVGYVDPSKLIETTFVPIVKTLDDITVDIKETSGTQIWSKPSTDGKILTTISAGSKNLKYIASCYGIIPSGGESNIWYYVYFTPSSNSTNVYEGYIYSENTTNLSEIIANAENNPEIIEDNQINENILYLSSSLKTIIIITITIPIVVFILIILYKSSKKIKEITNKQNFNKLSNNNQTNENYSFSNQYIHPSYMQNQNIYNNQNESLRDNLTKMRNTSFIKKSKCINNQQNYPIFPDYNADDELL